MNIKLIFLLTTLAAFSASAAAHQQKPSLQKLPMTLQEFTIPDIMLVDQKGRKVSLSKDIVEGHRLVIAFQFAACKQQCPVASAVLSAVDQATTGSSFNDIKLISITLDAEDTPEILQEKAQELGASAKWLWLTGAPEDLATANRAFGVPQGPKEEHDAFFLIGASTQFVRIAGIPSPENVLTELARIRHR